jgi:hypothetical protein
MDRAVSRSEACSAFFIAILDGHGIRRRIGLNVDLQRTVIIETRHMAFDHGQTKGAAADWIGHQVLLWAPINSLPALS